jgi:oligopeptidase A
LKTAEYGQFTMTNPLLQTGALPRFSDIAAEHVEPALDHVLAENRRAIAALLGEVREPTWQTLMDPLEDLSDRLNRMWSPVQHLHAVADNEALRAAYSACLPKLADYATELGQNRGLYEAYRTLTAQTDLDPTQRRILDNEMRDFRLSGIDLNPADQQRFKEISQRLSQLHAKFGDNVLDATQAWNKSVTAADMVSGLPEAALALAQQLAARHQQSGWTFTLDFPSYISVMTYADNRDLRQEVYTAFSTRASNQGPDAGKFDNSNLMVEILALRQEQARLLGLANFAELSLVKKMANEPGQVLQFLQDLAQRARPFAQQELTEIQAFAKSLHGPDPLAAWDISYYAEKLRQQRYTVSQELLRQYFPVAQVLDGLFRIVQLLYGIDITRREGIDVWQADVHYYEIHAADGELRGGFYLDLFARENKRGGAWMDECVVRRRLRSGVQAPVAYLTCNFTPPVTGRPALLTHEEVVTLFHEFGHGLQHMLTRVDYAGVSGINGVAWDAVELPSQFMENWCWEKEALNLFSRHHETGAPINDTVFERMQAAKNFQVGLQTLRQIEFALFDFRLHMAAKIADVEAIQAVLDQVRDEVAVIRPPEFNRFQHSFSHIFTGGYAAGYYSYKWAEVLAADAFSKFEEHGIFDRQTGDQFLRSILEQGGSREPMDLFVEFRGREPSIDALLRKTGMRTTSATEP